MKRRLSFILSVVLILSLFAACGQEKNKEEEGTVTLSFAEAVYWQVGTEGAKILNVVKAENFAGDPRFFIHYELPSGERFEVRIHGVTGDYEVGSAQFMTKDYTDNIILGDANPWMIHYSGEGDDIVYTDCISGGSVTKEAIEEAKKDTTREHEIYMNLLQHTPLRMDLSTVEAGIREVTGHTIVESDFAGLEERIVAAYTVFEKAHPEE